MKYIVRFKPAALVEFNNSTDWYGSKNPGLGARYVAAIDQAVDKVARNPVRASVVYRDVRLQSVEGFPYQIYYRLIREDVIEVLSVFHVRQNPSIWKSRV